VKGEIVYRTDNYTECRWEQARKDVKVALMGAVWRVPLKRDHSGMFISMWRKLLREGLLPWFARVTSMTCSRRNLLSS
jgi:hypothetical protein